MKNIKHAISSLSTAVVYHGSIPTLMFLWQAVACYGAPGPGPTCIFWKCPSNNCQLSCGLRIISCGSPRQFGLDSFWSCDLLRQFWHECDMMKNIKHVIFWRGQNDRAREILEEFTEAWGCHAILRGFVGQRWQHVYDIRFWHNDSMLWQNLCMLNEWKLVLAPAHTLWMN